MWKIFRFFLDTLEDIKKYISILFILGLFQSSYALESMGRFRFQEFVLSPSLEIREPSQGGFELKSSWISVQWMKDENIFGEMRLGTLDNLQAPVWFNTSASGLGLLEAWVEARSRYGRLRAGRLPIADGFESSFENGFWLMPSSQVRRNHWLFQRDDGVSYQAETKPWLTEIAVHNGESGSNADGKMWVSGRFQYLEGATGNGVLLTASEGATSAVSTSTSLAKSRDLFVFDPAKPAKIRYANLSLFHLLQRNYWNIEVGRGDLIQDEDRHPFAWARLDLSANLGGDVNLLTRYEHTQSDLKDSVTIQKIYGLGFLLSSRDQLSSVSLMGFHKEENPQSNNDEVLLTFRLNSTSL